MKASSAEVVRLPNRRQAREEASLWVARLDRGLSAEERRALDEWLAADSSHAAALVDLAALWDRADVLAELADLFPLEQQALAKPRVMRYALGACAAALAGAAVVVALNFVSGGVENAPPAVVAEQQAQPPGVELSAIAPPGQAVAQQNGYETAVGVKSTVPLSDGSVVTLNTDSAIEVRYDDTQRSVLLLRGEVYFEVAHDTSRPFRVRAGDQLLEAVGTAFNVRLGSSNDVRMMVTEGKVSVRPWVSPDALPRPSVAPAIVDAGSLAVMREGPIVVQGLDATEIEMQLSWQRGMLVFDGEPLDSVLLEIGRYTTVVFVPDDSIRDVRVGGYFRAGDIDGLLVALRESFDIDSRRTADGRIALFPAGAAR
jgi:transmembrane sensor